MTFKLGRLDARFPVMLSALAVYGTLPAAQEVWTGPPDGGFAYGLLGNDRYGNCEFAGYVHGAEAVSLLDGTTMADPSDQAVVTSYLTFTHGQDTGAVTADVLRLAQTQGICGIKVDAYVPGRGPLSELWQIIETFGTACLGVMLPAVAQEQFGAGEPWDLTGTSADDQIEGGHCVYGVAFDQGKETADVLTWGKRQTVTARWLERYLDEKWALIYDLVKTKGALDGFSFAQLEADLKLV